MATNKLMFKSTKRGVVMPLVLVIVVLSVGLVSLLYFTLFNSSNAANGRLSADSIKVPQNAIKISGCIPGQGEHWVEADQLPSGPFYVTHNGKVTAIEYMLFDDEIPGKDFSFMAPDKAMGYMQEHNLSLSDLVKQIDLTFTLPNIEFKRWGIHWTPPHAGLTRPHYDIHFFLIDEAEAAGICPEADFGTVLPQDLVEDLIRQGVEMPQAPK